jgi:hypothetical protein
MTIAGHWTPEQRAELLRVVSEQALLQIEQDPQLRRMTDWMIESCGLTPSPELYRLVFLTSVVASLGDAPGEAGRG